MSCRSIRLPKPALSVVALLSIFGPDISWADLDSGISAYRAGDYLTALRELSPLSEKGDPRAKMVVESIYESNLAKSGWIQIAASEGAIGVIHLESAVVTWPRIELWKRSITALEVHGNEVVRGGFHTILRRREEDPDGDYRISYIQTRERIDCGTRTITVLEYRTGLSGGREQKIPVDNPEIEYVSPGSPADAKLRSVCAYFEPLAQGRATPRTKERDSRGSAGTGFVINRRGHVLTAAHVIRGCPKPFAAKDGKLTALAVVSVDAANDVAVLTLPLPWSDFAVFAARPPQVGETVLSAGFPLRGVLADDLHVTVGTVTAPAGLRNDSRMLQISNPVQPGNSGGPIFNQRGEVAGLVVAKLDALRVAEATGDIPQNVNFALKLSTILAFLESAGVDYTIAPSTKVLDNSIVANRARKITFPIECQSQ